jgi:hypothetical protein
MVLVRSILSGVVRPVLDIIGRSVLTLYLAYGLKVIIGNFSNLVAIEEASLRSIENVAAGRPAGRGLSLALDRFTPELPPWAWVLVSVLTAIWLSIALIKQIENVIQKWVEFSRCDWKGFCGVLRCLLQLFWAIVTTIFTIFLIIFLIFSVLINIAALIAAFAA